MARQKLRSRDVLGIITEMSEGNPGAAVALAGLARFNPPEFIMTMLILDDMNIRGAQIWIGFKDFCGSDPARFFDKIKERDPGMVEFINRSRGHAGDQAVIAGASYMATRPVLDNYEG